MNKKKLDFFWRLLTIDVHLSETNDSFDQLISLNKTYHFHYTFITVFIHINITKEKFIGH